MSYRILLPETPAKYNFGGAQCEQIECTVETRQYDPQSRTIWLHKINIFDDSCGDVRNDYVDFPSLIFSRIYLKHHSRYYNRSSSISFLTVAAAKEAIQHQDQTIYNLCNSLGNVGTNGLICLGIPLGDGQDAGESTPLTFDELIDVFWKTSFDFVFPEKFFNRPMWFRELNSSFIYPKND